MQIAHFLKTYSKCYIQTCLKIISCLLPSTISLSVAGRVMSFWMGIAYVFKTQSIYIYYVKIAQIYFIYINLQDYSPPYIYQNEDAFFFFKEVFHHEHCCFAGPVVLHGRRSQCIMLYIYPILYTNESYTLVPGGFLCSENDHYISTVKICHFPCNTHNYCNCTFLMS